MVSLQRNKTFFPDTKNQCLMIGSGYRACRGMRKLIYNGVGGVGWQRGRGYYKDSAGSFFSILPLTDWPENDFENEMFIATLTLTFDPVGISSSSPRSCNSLYSLVLLPCFHITGISLMAEWLEQASQWHEVYCHDLEVIIMSSNPGHVELGVHSTSVSNCTWTKNILSFFRFFQGIT